MDKWEHQWILGPPVDVGHWDHQWILGPPMEFGTADGYWTPVGPPMDIGTVGPSILGSMVGLGVWGEGWSWTVCFKHGANVSLLK